MRLLHCWFIWSPALVYFPSLCLYMPAVMLTSKFSQSLQPIIAFCFIMVDSNRNFWYTTGMLSTGSAVATTAVVCSLVFLVIGVLVGVLCGHWTSVYRFSKQRNLKQPDSINGEPTPPAAPAPVYEELVPPELLTKEKDIELKENVAYGN